MSDMSKKELIKKNRSKNRPAPKIASEAYERLLESFEQIHNAVKECNKGLS